MLVILPVSASASDSAAVAVLRSGRILVDGQAVPPSTALFTGNVIENRGNAIASIDYQGSAAEIDPQTVIQLEDGEILLDHGTVVVTSVRQLRVRAGCVLATPAAAETTVYSVRDTDHRVTVSVQEKDVNLDSRSVGIKRANRPDSGHTVVHQGEQKSREEHCGAGDLHTIPPDATGGILNSPYVLLPAAVGIAGGILCVLRCLGDDPASPSSPSKSSITANHP